MPLFWSFFVEPFLAITPHQRCPSLQQMENITGNHNWIQCKDQWIMGAQSQWTTWYVVKWCIGDVKWKTKILKSGMDIKLWWKDYWKANFCSQKHILAEVRKVNRLQDQSPSTDPWSQRSEKQWPLCPDQLHHLGFLRCQEWEQVLAASGNVNQWDGAILEAHTLKKMILYGVLNKKMLVTCVQMKMHNLKLQKRIVLDRNTETIKSTFILPMIWELNLAKLTLKTSTLFCEENDWQADL